jgi:hypothetical protein
MSSPHPTRAELLSDSAVYRRTRRGQRELLRADDFSAAPALRILARINGFTDLRRLIDLAPGDVRELAASLEQLLDDGLIELVDGADGSADLERGAPPAGRLHRSGAP